LVREKAGLIEIMRGNAADVLVTQKVKKEYDRLIAGTDERSLRQQRTLSRYLKAFCDLETPHLNDEQFKKEASFSVGGGNKIAIWAFKAWQWRLYGAILSLGGRKTFIGARVDADKKQNKANREMMEAAAKEIAALSGVGRGRS
jgi:hypothetical protein